MDLTSYVDKLLLHKKMYTVRDFLFLLKITCRVHATSCELKTVEMTKVV